MPNYVRWREGGASYFLTLVTFRRRRLFFEPMARKLLKRAMVETRDRMPFDMFACVLMPDHLHMLWTLPDKDDNFPARVALIKSGFTRAYLAHGGRELSVSDNRKRHGERGIWQPRYYEHRIRDERDWYMHRDYIHLNPVHAGLCLEPEGWPWSSFHRHVRLGWLDPHWPGASPVALPAVPYD